MLPIEYYTALVKETSTALGFDFCGISKSDFLEAEAPRLETWLNKNLHGKMSYMENHFDKRLDPRLLVEGSKSVVSLLYNYHSTNKLASDQPDALHIAQYAYGNDYHTVIGNKLKTFLATLRAKIGDIQGRCFVDSAPVLEKAWAKQSGLGWIGKNTNLINKQQGSFFFLAELIIDLELIPDNPIKDYCGTCTRCLDACPTDALTPYWIDASKCISYFTIELKDQLINPSMKGKFENWIFGCDVCQSVCPWNRFATQHTEPQFLPHADLLAMTKSDWKEITDVVFGQLFKHSAVKRTKLSGLKRNIGFVLGKNQT